VTALRKSVAESTAGIVIVARRASPSLARALPEQPHSHRNANFYSEIPMLVGSSTT